jgi:putative MFS transporter
MPQLTWSLGAICAILLDAALYATVGSEAWRLMFAAGALPAIPVLLLRRALPDSPRWLLAQGRVSEAIGAFEQFGVTVLDASHLAGALDVAAPDSRPQTDGLAGWISPYAAIFRRGAPGAALFSILLIGLVPLNGIGQSVLGPYVLNQFGHLSPIGALLGGAVLWVGAIAGSVLAWKTVDRLGRLPMIVVSLVGYVVVYLLMVTVAFGTVALVPLYSLLGVVTWLGASACWPLPSELSPTSVRARAQGIGSGLQRVSIGVNVLLVAHFLDALGFRGTVLVATAISAAFVPYAIWGRRYEPARRSIDVISGDELLIQAAPDEAGVDSGIALPVP